MFINKKLLVRKLLFIAILALGSQTMVAMDKANPAPEQNLCADNANNKELADVPEATSFLYDRFADAFAHHRKENDTWANAFATLKKYPPSENKYITGISHVSILFTSSASIPGPKEGAIIAATALAFLDAAIKMTYLDRVLDYYYTHADPEQYLGEQVRNDLDKILLNKAIKVTTAKYCDDSNTECKEIVKDACASGIIDSISLACFFVSNGLLDHQRKTTPNYVRVSAQEFVDQYGKDNLVEGVRLYADKYLKKTWPDNYVSLHLHDDTYPEPSDLPEGWAEGSLE